MAEQKFLGEAGLDVLVNEIKTKLDTHQSFYELWKTDCYGLIDILNMGLTQTFAPPPSLGNVSDIFFKMWRIKIVSVSDGLTRISDKIESPRLTSSVSSLRGVMSSVWINSGCILENAVESVKTALDNVFNTDIADGKLCDGDYQSDSAIYLMDYLPAFGVVEFINLVISHPQATEITAPEVTNKLA